jgi:transcriptional regulator with PAS, ATPase and Fis domain
MKLVSKDGNNCFDARWRLIGNSESIKDVLGLISKVKATTIPVFIWGESGTGKELVARNIHQSGQRKNADFIAINCGAMPENLLESELFGYTKGAFTGAVRDKPGLTEAASGGTLFLDEIGDLSLPLQAKLLRLLQEGEIRRIGENRTRSIDARFISASNKNIEEEVLKGNFREDLYYRLKIVTIEISPLRERNKDIPLLIKHFIKKHSREISSDKIEVGSKALELLLNYSWPGNIRELENEIRRWLVLNSDSCLMKIEDLSSRINQRKLSYSKPDNRYFQAKAEFEKRFLNQALVKFGYNRTRTAEEIGLSRQGLFKLIKKHQIEMPK